MRIRFGANLTILLVAVAVACTGCATSVTARTGPKFAAAQPTGQPVSALYLRLLAAANANPGGAGQAIVYRRSSDDSLRYVTPAGVDIALAAPISSGLGARYSSPDGNSYVEVRNGQVTLNGGGSAIVALSGGGLAVNTNMVPDTPGVRAMGLPGAEWQRFQAFAFAGVVQSVAFSPTPAFSCLVSGETIDFPMTGAAAATMAAGFSGQQCTIVARQDTAGARVLTFNSGSAPIRTVGPLSAGPNLISTITFRYDSQIPAWVEMSRATGL
jgi:hypothetical protein